MNGMLVLALASEEVTFWTIALGIGAVVIAVVIALLTLLLKIVVSIDEGVAEVWQTATQLASNTTTVWQINTTLQMLDKVKEEALLHDELLSKS